MKTAIIIHGMPSKTEYLKPANPSPSNAHWLPWLQKQFILMGALAQTPEMPFPYDPRYDKWKTVFEQFHVDEETVLIGHSCGAGFLVRWLSENNVKVGQLILVAPWIDPTKELPSDNDFFNFSLDINLAQKTVRGITMFYSTDDDGVILQSVELLKRIQGIKSREFSDKGHFCIGDGVTEFPELLEEIMK